MKHDDLKEQKERGVNAKFNELNRELQEAIDLDAWLNAYITVLHKEMSNLKAEGNNSIWDYMDKVKQIWKKMRNVYSEVLPYAQSLAINDDQYENYLNNIYNNLINFFGRAASLPGEKVFVPIFPVILLCGIINNEMRRDTISKRMELMPLTRYQKEKRAIKWGNPNLLTVKEIPLSSTELNAYINSIYGHQSEEESKGEITKILSNRKSNLNSRKSGEVLTDNLELCLYESSLEELAKLKSIFQIRELVKTAIKTDGNIQKEQLSDVIIRLFLVNKYILNLSIIGNYNQKIEGKRADIYNSSWFLKHNNLITNWYLSIEDRDDSYEKIQENNYILQTKGVEEYEKVSGKSRKDNITKIIKRKKKEYISQISEIGLEKAVLDFQEKLNGLKIADSLPQILNAYLDFHSGKLDGEKTWNFTRDKSVEGWIQGMSLMEKWCSEIREEETKLGIRKRLGFLRDYERQLLENNIKKTMGTKENWLNKLNTALIKKDYPIIYFHIHILKTFRYVYNHCNIEYMRYVLVCGIDKNGKQKLIGAELIPFEKEEQFWWRYFQSLSERNLKGYKYIISDFDSIFYKTMYSSGFAQNAKCITKPYSVLNKAREYIDNEDNERLTKYLICLYNSLSVEELYNIFMKFEKTFGTDHQELYDFLKTVGIEFAIDFPRHIRKCLLPLDEFKNKEGKVNFDVQMEVLESEWCGMGQEMVFEKLLCELIESKHTWKLSTDGSVEKELRTFLSKK